MPYRFGPLEEIARAFTARMGDAADRTELGDDGFMVTTVVPDAEEVSNALVLRFGGHPLFGMACRLDLVLPSVPADAHAAAAGRGAMELYFEPTASLMGAWVSEGDSLGYRQWITSDEVRGYEQLGSFAGFTPDLLWGVASTSSDALGWALDAVVRARAGSPEPPELAASLDDVLAPLTQGGRALDGWLTGTDAADRRLLWWPHLAILIVAGWFNPVGPTLSTLELRHDPVGGRVRLVLLRRHPLLPRYVDLGTCQTDEELAAALAAGMEHLAEGSLPNVVSLRACPADLVEPVVQALRVATEQRAGQTGASFADTAARIRDTLGQPWAYAGGQRDDRFDAEIASRPAIPEDAGFLEWLAIATDDLNGAANASTFPDAWDGAINVQRSAGNVESGMFDVGPFVLTYSSIGMSEPDAAG